MLSDRSYMRGLQRFPSFTLIPWFLGVVVGVFIVQNMLERWFGLSSYYQYTALSGSGLRQGYAWTVLTYALLHGGVMHLLLNGLGLFFLGRELEASLGTKRLVQLTLTAVLFSALFWLGVNFARPGQVVGASGVVMAYLMVFACLQPQRSMTFLLFFIIPVTLKPFWIVAILAGIDLFGFFFSELPGGSGGWIAHSAHLGGLAGGWVFFQTFVGRAGLGSAPTIEAPRWLRKAPAREPGYTVNLSGRAAPTRGAAPVPSMAGRDRMRAEVDRILDKINERGFGALSADEKRVLDEARQVLGPR
jgi:membrane associated rhomboid family serine protease